MKKETIVAIEAIKKKLTGKTINYDESYAIMNQFVTKELGDIFVAYFTAASFHEGFSDQELYFLTKAMINTGKTLHFDGIVADKHSIGGMPGTRTTLIVVPIIAACGFLIPKTSSRAITTPAGTADCMEVLAKVDFSTTEVTKIVNKIGGCIVWNDKLGLAPADDIIIRVEAPLAFESWDKIMISILAKKIAAGSKYMILDIPVGPTMKIKYVKDALQFAEKYTQLAKLFSLEVKSEINYQYAPTGIGVGPMLEVIDALSVLEQKKDRQLALEDKSLKLASRLLDMCLKASNKKGDGLVMAEAALTSGKALAKFKEIILAQNGNPDINSDSFKLAEYKGEIIAQKSGFIKEINNYNISALARILGAPLMKKSGLRLLSKFNQKISKNDILLEMYSEDREKLVEAQKAYLELPVYTVE